MNPFVFLLLVFLFAFALYQYGLNQGWFGSSHAPEPEQPNLQDDLQAAHRLIAYLYSQDVLTEEDRNRIHQFLTTQIDNDAPAPFPQLSVSQKEASSVPSVETPVGEAELVEPTLVAPASGTPIEQADPNDAAVQPPTPQPKPPAAGLDQAPQTTPQPRPQPRPAADALPQPRPAEVSVSASRSEESIAPWDQPDPPTPTPRRTFQEMLAGFMEEKNMRWGELTSGVLIVLSAIGLVVSLRDQLSDRVPYFSALLFLLITAAVHGAGIYTLKKWRLKNTSRGTLLIGLLLIPVNFLAACLLNGDPENRAPFGDAWYIAAVPDRAGFIWQFVLDHVAIAFQKGHWPLVGRIDGAPGAATLAVNRLVTPEARIEWSLLAVLPILLSFCVGTAMVSRGQWRGQVYSGRAIRRLYTFLGIATFAALNAIALVAVRAESVISGITLMLPTFSVIGVGIAWFGMLHRGRDTDADSQPSLVGLSLQVFGWSTAIVTVVAAVSNPTLFSITCFVMFVAIVGVFWSRNRLALLPLAFPLLIASGLWIFLQANNKLPYGQLVSMSETFQATVTASSALFLLGASLLVGAIAWLSRSWRIDDSNQQGQQNFFYRGMGVAGLTLAGGGLLSLVASLMNREVAFEVTVANAVMTIGSIAIIAAIWHLSRKVNAVAEEASVTSPVATWLNRQETSIGQLSWAAGGLAIVAIGWVLATLSHGLIWDLRVNDWLASHFALPDTSSEKTFAWVQHPLFAPGLIVLTATGLVAALLTRISWPKNLVKDAEANAEDSAPALRAILLGQKFTQSASVLATLLTLIASLGSLFLVPAANYWATGIAIVAASAWFLLGRIFASREDVSGNARKGQLAYLPFLTSATLALLVLTSELGLRSVWFDGLLDASHWLILSIGVSVSVLAISSTRLLAHAGEARNWLTKSFSIESVLLPISIICASLFLGDRIVRGIANEIVGDAPWGVEAYQHSIVAGFDVVASMLPWMSLGFLAFAGIVCLYQQPRVAIGFTAVTVWFLAWGYGATCFAESNSVATAFRWLMPIGGLSLAAIISIRRRWLPVWAKARSGLSQPGRSLWSADQARGLIDLLLIVSTLSVLLVSTLTTAQVLLNSPTSLGGPAVDSWFKLISIEANFGLPLAIVVATYLWLAISEKRILLATMGSAVFQTVVVIAIYFLVMSPHPKIASRWFIGILQTVSIGMTIYGLVWYYFRAPIMGRIAPASELDASGAATNDSATGWQLRIHTLINGCLMTGMAVVVLYKTLQTPDVSVGWVNAFGSWLGLLAIVAFVVLTLLVWKESLLGSDWRTRSSAVWSALIGWSGLVSTAMVIAVVDRISSGQEGGFGAWSTHRILAVGFLLVAILQGTWVCRNELRQSHPSFAWGRLGRLSMPTFATLFLIGAIGIFAGVQGVSASPDWIWGYGICLFIWTAVAFSVGLVAESSFIGIIAAFVSSVSIWQFLGRDPGGLFRSLQPNQPYEANLVVAVVGCLAIAWLVGLARRRGQVTQANDLQANDLQASDAQVDSAAALEAQPDYLMTPPSPMASVFPNISMVGVSVWIALLGLGEIILHDSSFSPIANPIGCGVMLIGLGLFLFNTFSNPNARGRVFSGAILSTMIAAIAVSSWLAWRDGWSSSWLLLTVALVVLGWGLLWVNRQPLATWARRRNLSWLRQTRDTFENQLPTYTVVASAILLVLPTLAAFAGSWADEFATRRYALASIPIWLGISMGLQSSLKRRWLQSSCLALLTLGAIYLSIAEIPVGQRSPLSILVRAFTVLGSSMFIYGVLVTRWVRQEDGWLQTLRKMTASICIISVVVLAGLIFLEAIGFEPGVGCGLTFAQSMGVAVVMLGMAIGLIVLALRPENDPFRLSLNGRMAYVYVAELVAVALVAHLYFSAPWLFQFGLREYWPFIVMAICFVGVGVAEVLSKRDLKVLSVPLFNTASILPVLVAAMSFLDARQLVAGGDATTMLAVGGIYLLTCYLRKSVASGAACVVFGNAALWLFFHKFPALAFFEHPQLWLIPPAASVLVAAHLLRDKLPSTQLNAIRYLAAAVIYVSSTSEIFIRGIGDSLWPPMLLAVLAIAGILVGILMRIRAFLFLGMLFLLLAMVTMVSHAHQRFEHVWPWWAFGIGMGIAILVMFGLFEKRKNEMRRLTENIRQWE